MEIGKTKKFAILRTVRPRLFLVSKEVTGTILTIKK